MDDLDHDDNLELPPVPLSARKAAQTPPRPSFLLSRKRTRADYDDEPATSSDPAIFSSDEQAPGAENYAVADGRKKRTYKGSWWDRHPVKDGARHSTRKREFKRNYDSGIFMGSEGTEDPLSSDSFSLEEELMRDQQSATGKKQPQQNGSPLGGFGPNSAYGTPRAKLPPQPTSIVPKGHEAVCEIVKGCLETGKEDVDLSFMSLYSLPAEVTSLQTLSKQDEIVPGMLDTGTNLEPHLRLYLGNNLFTKFPTPILDLRNLRVLSLRQNNLSFIPPTIRDLVNLESLNVAGNNLTELPFEILELIRLHKLQQLTTEPNPWREIEPSVERKWRTTYHEPAVSETGLRFFMHASSKAHSESDLNVERLFGNVPSLTETVLRQLAKIDPQQKIDFRTFMPPDSPSNVLGCLEILAGQPGQRCTTCKRPLVLAGTEWVEWWCLLDQRFLEQTPMFAFAPMPALPFRRVQCWHGCRGTKANWTLDQERSTDVETGQPQSATTMA